MNKDNGMLWSCMCSLIEILWLLEEKIKLVWYFYYLWEAKSIWKKSKPLKQLFDALDTNSLTLMRVLKLFSEIFL